MGNVPNSPTPSEPFAVPDATEILEDIANRFDLTAEQVERTLAEANITLRSPAPADRRIRILRLRANGVKRSGEVFSLQQKFAPGVWAIVHPDNSAGKTSFLEFLVWPLRGAPRDLPLDVRSWLRYLCLDVLIAGKPARITLERSPDSQPSLNGRILTADSTQQILESDDAGLRPVAEASGTDEVSRMVGRFLLDGLRMEHTKLWQATGGADGEGAPQLHGWSSYFGACYLNPGGDEILLGDVNAVGLSARLLELFVDIPYSTALTQLSVAGRREQKAITQMKRRTEGDAEARRLERNKWLEELNHLQQQIAEARAEASQDVSGLMQRADRAAVILRERRDHLAEAEQALADVTAARIRAEQAHMDGQESWQARKVLGRLNPVCCPRCEEPLGRQRHIAEREHAACAVCARPLPEVEAETAEAILQQLADELASARAVEEEAIGKRALARREAESAQTAYQDENSSLERALVTSETYSRLRELELQAARVEGRLATTEITTQDPSPSPASQVLAAVEDTVRSYVDGSARRLFPAMNAQIVELATRFGVQNLDSVKLDRAGRVNATKAGIPTIFKKLSRGDRLRMRIATVIALLRVGSDRGVAAHPGLLLIDSVATEEVTEVSARVLITELQAIAQELPDLQVILTTAQPELIDGLLPNDHIITSDTDHLF